MDIYLTWFSKAISQPFGDLDLVVKALDLSG